MNNQSLLFKSEREILPISDGRLDYYPNWLSPKDADDAFTELKKTVQWQQSILTMYGKPVAIPRLNAWYGDQGRDYGYSGHRFTALHWLPLLHRLKLLIEAETNHCFNSVLVNCYRDENDSVAWHSDDEPELKKNPVIASLSLGAERVFQLRHRYQKQAKATNVDLAHGSLLVMSEELQHNWQHQLPKLKTKTGERINLTYRYIHA